MTVPDYNELLERCKVKNYLMEQTFNDDHLKEFALNLDAWEVLAKFLMIPNSEIENIKSQGDTGVQRIRMLECWKQRCGSAATYEKMVKALLQINRTDLAEQVTFLLLRDFHTSAGSESSPDMPPSSASSSGTEDTSIATMSSSLDTPSVHTACEEEVISNLKKLEEEFYRLVHSTEAILKNSRVCLETITNRFRMLPQSIRRLLQTDENYTATRQRILNSTTVKELFDNLTDLKHWSYMTPDTLTHILQDVDIDEVHQMIDKYKKKLTAFKIKTNLRDVINLSFPVPDYCKELTTVEDWEYKTINNIEKAAMNYYGQIGWKRLSPGCIRPAFILIDTNLDENYVKWLLEVCKYNGVTNIQVDGVDEYSNGHTTEKVVLLKPQSKCYYD